MSLDISVLRIAIDGRASTFVRTELARILSTIEGTSPQGRTARLREVSLTLRRVRDSWMYGGAVNDPSRSDGEARAAFARHVEDARGRISGEPAPADARQASVLVVTIVVAARGALAPVSAKGAGEELRRALEAAVHRDDIVALDVVWAPEEDDRVLSAIQLEAQYPDLYRLRGTVVGNVYCTYCGGPFPAELVSCPHCGAPARGRDRDRQAIA